MAEMKNSENAKCRQRHGAVGGFVHFGWKCKLVKPLWRATCRYPLKLNGPCNPAVLLGASPAERECTKDAARTVCTDTAHTSRTLKTASAPISSDTANRSTLTRWDAAQQSRKHRGVKHRGRICRRDVRCLQTGKAWQHSPLGLKVRQLLPREWRGGRDWEKARVLLGCCQHVVSVSWSGWQFQGRLHFVVTYQAVHCVYFHRRECAALEPGSFFKNR